MTLIHIFYLRQPFLACWSRLWIASVAPFGILFFHWISNCSMFLVICVLLAVGLFRFLLQSPSRRTHKDNWWLKSFLSFVDKSFFLISLVMREIPWNTSNLMGVSSPNIFLSPLASAQQLSLCIILGCPALWYRSIKFPLISFKDLLAHAR